MRPGAWRWTDPQTAKESGLSINASAREYDVLRMLADQPGPLNGWEMSLVMRWPTITVVPRLAPLRRKGMIVQRATRPGPPPNHKAQIAYVVTPYGLAFLANAQRVTPRGNS